jgi:hypothetical protein
MHKISMQRRTVSHAQNSMHAQAAFNLKTVSVPAWALEQASTHKSAGSTFSTCHGVTCKDAAQQTI